ncbi:MAG: ATP-binding protein [Plesiomonas shigelloides]
MNECANNTFETGVTLNCEKHGDYPQKKLRWPGGKETVFSNCPKCVKELRDDALAKEQERKEIEERARWERARANAGVSPRNAEMRFKNYRTDTPEQQHVHDVCHAYAKRVYDGERVESLIITGKVGTGKTMIATCMINALYKSKRVLIVKLADMLRYIKGSYQPGAEYTEFQAIDKFSSYDLLILDEVGASRETDNDKLLIFDVIDGRYQNMLPTVIISNLNIDGIKDVLGDRVVDRLRDGGGKMIGCNWDSHRK